VAAPNPDAAAFGAAVESHLDFAAPVVALVQNSPTDAAQIVQSPSILALLETQVSPLPVSPPPALGSVIEHGLHIISPPDGSTSAGLGSPGSVGTVAPSSYSPLVTAAVEHFLAEVSVLDVANSGREIILFDGALLKPLPPGTELDSVTYSFNDGSSISLVGTVAELQYLHLS
jgi:hypothetical protein